MVRREKNQSFPCQHQLGGSGKKNVLRDLLDTGQTQVIELTELRRINKADIELFFMMFYK